MRLRLALLALFLLLAVSPFAGPIRAGPAHPPHEDPKLALSRRDAYHWIAYYGEVLDLLLAQDPDAARALLEELGRSNLPLGLEDRLRRLDSSLLLAVDGIKVVQEAVEAIPGLLESNRVAEATQRFQSARVTLLDLESQIPNLSAAAAAVAEGLGATRAPPGTRQREAFEAVADRTSQLLTQYQEGLRYLDGVRDAVQALEVSLRPATLGMVVDRDSALVGEAIEVSGQLTSRDEPLPGRRVVVASSLNVSVPTTTAEDGSFRVALSVPYAYVTSFTLWTLYVPEGQDATEYQGVASAKVLVNLRFFRTSLEASWPRQAHPGKPMLVVGKLVGQGEVQLSSRRLRLLLDGRPFAEGTVDSDFQVEAVLPADALPGSHRLKVEVDPDFASSGASVENDLDLELLPTGVQVGWPRVVLAPGKLRVSGAVSSPGGALGPADIRVSLDNRSVDSQSAAGGKFASELPLPWSLALFGPHVARVVADPNEPWAASGAGEGSLFVVNLADVGLFLVAAATLVGLAMRKRMRVAVAPASTPAMPAPVRVEPHTASVPQRPLDFRSRVLGAYAEGTEAALRYTGRQMAPNVTLRGFLREARPALGGTGNAYAELTLAGEVALYSPADLSEEQAIRAEHVAHQVVEALTGGPA